MKEKQRLFNREEWTAPKMRRMPYWAQLLHLNMYFDQADSVGIVELDLDWTAYNTNMKQVLPNDYDVVAKALAPYWSRHTLKTEMGDREMFIMHNFIKKTTGKGYIVFNNHYHVDLLHAIERHIEEGFLEAPQLVNQYNPTVIIEPIEITMKNIQEGLESKDSNKKNGYKGNYKALMSARRVLQVIGSVQELGFKTGSRQDYNELEATNGDKIPQIETKKKEDDYVQEHGGDF